MQIYSTSRIYSAANGYRILRPADRSCWILLSPNSTARPTYGTRRAAHEAAKQRSQRST